MSSKENARRKCVKVTESQDLNEFEASISWLKRFKLTYKLKF